MNLPLPTFTTAHLTYCFFDTLRRMEKESIVEPDAESHQFFYDAYKEREERLNEFVVLGFRAQMYLDGPGKCDALRAVLLDGVYTRSLAHYREPSTGRIYLNEHIERLCARGLRGIPQEAIELIDQMVRAAVDASAKVP